MDFDKLPNEQIVHFLRETGCALLRQAILREPLHIELTKEQQRWFLTTHRSPLPRRRERHHGQFLWTWLQDATRRIGILPKRPASNSLVGSTQLVIEGRLLAATWESRLINRIEGQMGNVSLGDIPFELWGWLGVAAWEHPEFVAQTTVWTETYLHENALFAVGERPQIHFAPETYWLLIGLACAQINEPPFKNRVVTWLAARRWGKHFAIVGERWGRWLSQFFHEHGSYAHALQQIVTVCERYGLGEGWAGGWDRWVLLEALRYWSGDKQKSKLYLAVHALKEGAPLAKLEWQTGMPIWFEQWRQKKQ